MPAVGGLPARIGATRRALGARVAREPRGRRFLRRLEAPRLFERERGRPLRVLNWMYDVGAGRGRHRPWLGGIEMSTERFRKTLYEKLEAVEALPLLLDKLRSIRDQSPPPPRRRLVPVPEARLWKRRPEARD